ncbi:hypothetical protein [Moraxella boevrei]|uniref:hypothetical protein n=1 Tax=Faucicola boevrei TaxID=346665 RepID=UPI003734FF1A
MAKTGLKNFLLILGLDKAKTFVVLPTDNFALLFHWFSPDEFFIDSKFNKSQKPKS